ncbi:MAG: hypothetical protein RI100_02825 [Nitrosarchaeum sp.]|jgi:predicted amidophosphoribosyltransferase|uniref:hypothetical protein n=1 Tax=Nitrosarchaeum sp. TaxID=2026886 RepID=UPI002DE43DFA|nr:hypothetical protein [Nitrosarchaeum sp.]
MPDESCRNCRMNLRVQNKCSTCMEPIQQICSECRYATLERIHTRCASGLEMISTVEPPVQIFPVITI